MGQVREFCEAITGEWVQVKNENMDAINAGSGFGSPLYSHNRVDKRDGRGNLCSLVGYQ